MQARVEVCSGLCLDGRLVALQEALHALRCKVVVETTFLSPRSWAAQQAA